MDIREAQYIIEIGKTQNLTKAANNLFITQPTLSKVLKKLEQEFQTPLFFKNGRQLLPTETGKIVIEYSGHILKEFNEMNRAIGKLHNKDAGSFRLGIPDTGSFLYAPLLVAFSIEHPHINIKTYELGGSDIVDWLLNDKLDAAFVFLPRHFEEFNESTLFSSEMEVGVNSSHPFAKKEFIDFQDFDDQPYVSFGETATATKMLNEQFKKYNVTPKPKMSGSELDYLFDYARATNTPCIFSRPVLDYYSWPGMVIIPLRPTLPWDLRIVHPKSSQSMGIINTFSSFITHHIRSKEYNRIIKHNDKEIDISYLIDEM